MEPALLLRQILVYVFRGKAFLCMFSTFKSYPLVCLGLYSAAKFSLGPSCTYVLAVSNSSTVSEIMTPQHLAWAPEISSSFIPVCWSLEPHSLLGGVILAC